MNFWMRWVNFRSLRDMLVLVKANPASLRAKDLARLTTDERILLGKDGQPLVLQLQKCGEEFQAASVMAAPGRCLVPPSPPGPPQH